MGREKERNDSFGDEIKWMKQLTFRTSTSTTTSSRTLMLYTVHKDEKFDEHGPKQTKNSKTHKDASPSIVMKNQTSHAACEQVPEADGEKHVKNSSASVENSLKSIKRTVNIHREFVRIHQYLTKYV